MTELQLLEKAIGIAVEAHRGKQDRYGAPFILHPLRVMGRVSTAEAQTVAVLHDVVEDTRWTFEDLEAEGFPPRIIEALKRVTKQEGEEYEQFVRRSASNPLARIVRLADLEDNMDISRMPHVSEEDLERLQKYLRAWKALTSKAENGLPLPGY